MSSALIHGVLLSKLQKPLAQIGVETAGRKRVGLPPVEVPASGWRFLGRVFDELSEGGLRDAVQDLTRAMSDEEFDRLVERTDAWVDMEWAAEDPGRYGPPRKGLSALRLHLQHCDGRRV